MTVGDILETLKSLARVPIKHVVDPARLRPSDVTLQIPDTSKFHAATGWQPEIPARQDAGRPARLPTRQHSRRGSLSACRS